MKVPIDSHAMRFVWATIPLVLIFAFVIPYSFADFHIDESVLTWSQASYKIANGTGTAAIVVNDNDKNENPFFAEKVKVFVYSDSFPEGITIELYETEKNSGKFERTFSFSDSRSAPSILLAREGDTTIAVYTDEPLPHDYLYQTVDFTATALIGSTGPPLERAPASNARIVNLFGNFIDSPSVGEQVQITSDISNEQDREQKFAYLVMIQDDTNTAVSLAWIDGTLNPESSFSPASSWIPQKEGDYTATMFVWESVDNPTALSPPIQMEFSVGKENPEKTMFDSNNISCMGNELCISETIVRIVDGDTLYLQGGYEVRLSLTNTPERYERGFYEASQFTAKICPVMMTAVFDQDDKQPYDVYNRLVGKITCNDKVLNSELLYTGHANILKQYCATSEFSDESWAKEFGC